MTDSLVHNGICAATGKIARTKEDAEAAAARRPFLRAYDCGNHYHISHEKGRVMSSRRNRSHKKHI